jgi:SAM-dependent methyltransferase
MSPAPNFNHLSRPYRWLEYLTFGTQLQRTRTQFLDSLHANTSAPVVNTLVLGDGDGRFTAALFVHHPAAQVHAIDSSPAMLQLLTQRVKQTGHQTQLTTEQADLRHWTPTPGASFNLIATHFFLDCLTTQEVSLLARRLNNATTPNAFWLISDFAIPPGLFGRIIAAPIVALLYRSFALLTGLRIRQLPHHAAALTAAGWALVSEVPRLRGLLVSQLWQRSAESISAPAPALK